MCKVRAYTYTCGHTAQFRLSTCRGTITRRKLKRCVKTRGVLRTTFSKEEMATIVKDTKPMELKNRLLLGNRKHVSVETRIVKRPKCVMKTEMVIQSNQKCGPCQYNEFNDERTKLLGEANERISNARIIDQEACEYIIGHKIPEQRAELNVELLERARDRLAEQLDGEKWRIRHQLAPDVKGPLGSLKMLDRVSTPSPLSHEVPFLGDDGEEEVEWESEEEVSALEILVISGLNLIRV